MKEIEKIINYNFSNEKLLEQAFTTKAYSNEHHEVENNQVLEFIGDKALDLVVINYLMKKYSNIDNLNNSFFKTPYDEGFFSSIKSEIVNKESLAKFIDNLHLQDYLIMSNGEKLNNLNNQDSNKEDLFEAIIGAIAIDCNWNIEIISNSVNAMINLNSTIENIVSKKNYVNLVQEWSQKNYGVLPKYDYEESDGFICKLFLHNFKGYFKGVGKSKIEARKLASQEAYSYLEKKGYLHQSVKDLLGDISLENAINKLQELYQKKIIEEPLYTFYSSKEQGEDFWICECRIKGEPYFFVDKDKSKTDAKKRTSYEMLLNLINEYDKANN